MKNYLFIIAALISFNSFGQVHKSVETVSDGSKNKVPMELVVLSEPSEGAFFASLSTEFTDLVFGEETLESVGKDELLNRIAISSSIKAKYMCSVKASWVPESVNFMWSEDKSEHFAEFVKRTRIQDKYRDESFDELYPVISNYIRKNHK